MFSMLLAAMLAAQPAHAAAAQDCVKPAVVLWGDGRHDDTAALSAWFRGDNALWGDSGGPVGTVIAGHDFRLSGAIYVSGGGDRTLQDFRFVWPERRETVIGGTIRTGNDPNQAPSVSGVRILGGDAGEGKALDRPDLPPVRRKGEANCGIS